MKCPNCGFNCDDKYCAMCGTKMPEQVVNTNPNPYVSSPVNNNFQPANNNQPNNADFGAGFGNTNPYSQPQAPVNNTNSYSYNQPQAPVNNNTNSFTNGFQNGAPNIPQGGMPVPPAYPAPPQYSNAPKKKSKALPIIMSCLIAAVIVAGAVISVYSACTYNKSIITDIFGDTSDYYDDYYVDEEYYPDLEYIEDTDTHKLGEAKELPDCNIKLLSAERDPSVDATSDGNSRLTFTFEIENTTDEDISFEYFSCDAYSVDDYDYYEWLSDNLNDDSGFDVEANKKKEVTFSFSVPNKAEKFELDIYLSNYYSNYEYWGTFETE